MSDHNVVLTVAAYASPAAAGQDFDAVGRARDGDDAPPRRALRF